MSTQRIMGDQDLSKESNHTKRMHQETAICSQTRERSHSGVLFSFFFQESEGLQTQSQVYYFIYTATIGMIQGDFNRKKNFDLEGRDDFSTQQQQYIMTCSFYCSESTCIKKVKRSKSLDVAICSRAILWSEVREVTGIVPSLKGRK